MSSDLAALVGELSPYATAAVSAYGSTVLKRVQDDAADATVGLGRRLLQRIFGVRDAAETPQALAELAEDPEDADLQAALRVQIRRILAEDDELVAELRRMLTDPPPASMSIVASGERSIAAQIISGTAVIGDSNTVIGN